mgnify:FL=1
MSIFKTGGIPTPDYDSENVYNVYKKAEFSQDIFVYGDAYVFGKLYAEFDGDVQSFNTAGIERLTIQKDGQVVFKNIGTGETNSTEKVRIDPNGQVILTSNGISGGGIYHHKRTISTSGTQFFKLENQHGATAATIYLSASEVEFSVSKVYQFAGQHNGGSGGLNLVADSGAYSGKNINLTVNSTQDVHQFTCTATGSNVEVFVTIVVGCANTNMVFTKQ